MRNKYILISNKKNHNKTEPIIKIDYDKKAKGQTIKNNHFQTKSNYNEASRYAQRTEKRFTPRTIDTKFPINLHTHTSEDYP